jgi:hypothetical protein
VQVIHHRSIFADVPIARGEITLTDLLTSAEIFVIADVRLSLPISLAVSISNASFGNADVCEAATTQRRQTRNLHPCPHPARGVFFALSLQPPSLLSLMHH